MFPQQPAVLGTPPGMFSRVGQPPVLLLVPGRGKTECFHGCSEYTHISKVMLCCRGNMYDCMSMVFGDNLYSSD